MPALPGRGQAEWDVPLNAFLLTGMNTDGTLKNSPTTLNVKTDYGAEGDGFTDDAAAINAAITAAAVSNANVFFPEGVYRISTDIVVQSDVSIRGVGSGTVIKPTDSSGDTAGRGFLGRGVSNVTISDLVYDGNATGLTQASGHSAVFMSGIHRCRIERVRTQNLGRDVAGGSGSHIMIRAFELGDPNASIRDFSNTASRHNIIKDCVLDDSSGFALFGIQLFTDHLFETNQSNFTIPVEFNHVLNNTVIGFTQNGVEVAGPRTRRNVVFGNISRDHMGDAGLELDKGASHNTFMGNIVANVLTNAGSQPTYAFRCQGGVSGGGLDRIARHNTLVGNVVDEMPGGLAASAGFGFARCEHNICEGNTIDVEDSLGQAYGVFVADRVKHLLVSDNHICNAQDGVRNETTLFETNATAITVRGNQIYATRNGIWFANLTNFTYTDVVVEGNLISDATNVGIHLGTGMDDCTAIGNHIRECATNISGIRIDGARAVVFGNVVRDLGSGTNVELQANATAALIGTNFAP